MPANNKIFVLLLLACFTPALWAAGDTNRFEHYKNEYTKLHNNYVKSPNDIAAIAALAYFYSEADNPMRNLPLAMDYIQISEKKYRELALDKSKYREVNRLIKKGFTIVELRQRKQFIIDEARKYVKNGIQPSETEAFRKAFPNDRVIIRQLALQNNKNKYRHALELGTEKAYKEYLAENPVGEERSEIVAKLTKILTDKLSFAQSETEVDSILNGYTEPQIIQLGTRQKSEIAYREACMENTYSAYRNFLRKYPTSNKYDVVLNTMDTLLANQLKYLKTPKEYCDFALKNSDMPQSEQAVDSLIKMATSYKNSEALKLYLSNFPNDDNYNDVYKSYYHRFSKEGNMAPVVLFKKQNPNFPLSFVVEDDLKTAEEIDKIEVMKPFDENDAATYGEYVKKYMRYGMSLVFLQRIIQPLTAKNNWNEAIALLDKYELCFEDNCYEDYMKLRTLLATTSKNKPSEVFAPTHVNVLNAQKNDADASIYFTKKTDFFTQVAKTKIPSSKNVKSKIELVNFSGTENDKMQFFSMSENGKLMLTGKGGDIYIAKKKDTTWYAEKIKNNSLNGSFYEGDANFTPDGTGMLFISDRPGGYNVNLSGMLFHGDTALASDIYYIPKNGDNWGEPVNLGPKVNSDFSERSPVLSHDLKTLYFTSDRHGGLGYYDIYMCTRTDMNSWTEWSQPVNIGRIANTSFSEPTISLSADEKQLYFSSDKNGGQQYSVYSIPTNHAKEPFYKTLTINFPQNINTENFIIYVKDETSNALVHQYKYSPKNTSLKFDVFQSKNYSITCKSPQTFIPVLIFYGNNNTFYIKSYPLDEAIAKKTHIPLTSIIFEAESKNPDKLSDPEISHLADFMKENPDIKIEIISNVDIPQNKSAYKLSQERSNELKLRLISEGVSPERIVSAGFGNLNYQKNKNTSPVEIIFSTK